MSQTRFGSAVEAVTNVAIGYAVSVALTATVLPAFGHHVDAGDALGISAVFAVASLLRSYLLRRLFRILE